MRCPSLLGACLAALISSAFALEFTSPTSGSGIDPTQPLLISWSVNITDPSLIDLRITNSNPNALTTDMTLATGVAADSGSYTVPANIIQNFGTGYEILATSNGNTIAQVTGLVLGGASNQVSTDANGQLTLVTSASSLGASIAAASTTSETQQGTDAVTTAIPTASIESVGITTLSGTVTGSEATESPTISRTGSSFVTSTASKTSSASSAAATSAESTNTANGQRRLGGEFVLSAAGVLAGVVALLA